MPLFNYSQLLFQENEACIGEIFSFNIFMYKYVIVIRRICLHLIYNAIHSIFIHLYEFIVNLKTANDVKGNMLQPISYQHKLMRKIKIIICNV